MSRRTQNSWLLHPDAGRDLPPRNVPVSFVALAKESTGPKRDQRFPCQRANALSGPTRLPSAQVWQDGSAFALYGVAPNIEAAVEAAGRAPLVVLSPTEGTELAVRLLAQETPSAADSPDSILMPRGYLWRLQQTRWSAITALTSVAETSAAA